MALLAVGLPLQTLAAADKPNILVIMSDDVGITNISAYSRGLAGCQTPNIDRIANEGMMFTEQRKNYFDVWSEPFVKLRIPKLFNLRTDPFERADTYANNYRTWWIRRFFTLVPSQVITKEFIDNFKEFPL